MNVEILFVEDMPCTPQAISGYVSTKFGHCRDRIKGTIVVMAKYVHNPQFSTTWLELHLWDRTLMISFNKLHQNTHTTPAHIHTTILCQVAYPMPNIAVYTMPNIAVCTMPNIAVYYMPNILPKKVISNIQR